MNLTLGGVDLNDCTLLLDEKLDEKVHPSLCWDDLVVLMQPAAGNTCAPADSLSATAVKVVADLEE